MVRFSHYPTLLKLTSLAGENPYMSWAKILDCGDAPLTFLDNTVALKQLEKAHNVSKSATRHCTHYRFQCMLTCYASWSKVLSGRQAKAKQKSLIPRKELF